MSDQKGQYRSVAKGTAIFGGVQVFQILINIVRGKFVAMFLGPDGMGIMSLFTSTTSTINQFTGLGLSFSAVKEISQANEQGDMYKFSRVVTIFRRLTTLTGILAVLIAIIGAPWLSELTFGSRDYTWGFMALAVMLFFLSKGAAETSLLQGMRQIKSLAKSTLIGSAVGLIVGVPLFAIFGYDGIVPSMIVAAVAAYITNRYFTSKIKIEKINPTTADIVSDGRSMVSLGVVMMVSTLVGTVTIYLINIYIRWYGDAADVGLYQAATSFTSQYVNLVFAAMAVDYFPRLAAIATESVKVRQTVITQMELVILLVAPIVITIMVTAPMVIRLLLTTEFLPITTLLCWLSLGLIFKAISYPIGYIAIAKGDKKTYFWYDSIYGNSVTLTLSILGYSIYGLDGLGMAFAVSYVIYFVSIYTVARLKYDFILPTSFFRLIAPLVLLGFATFILFAFISGYCWWSYLVGGVLLGASGWYSYYHLNLMIGIKELIMSKFSKQSDNEK